MILAVDIGNTLIKIGAFDDRELVFVSRLQTNTLKTMDEYAINMLEIFRLYRCNASQFDGGIISSVVPQLSSRFKSAMEAVMPGKKTLLLGPGLETGLDIRIDNPTQLGGDMACAAVAAMELYPLPCIMISLGTATSLFAMDRDGAFLGGALAPGLGISLDALAQKTAQLPNISLDEPGKIIGTNTVDSMRAGAIYGTAFMLDGFIRRMREQIGEDATVIASGGLAQFVMQHCEADVTINDELVLQGLRIIYHKNVK